MEADAGIGPCGLHVKSARESVQTERSVVYSKSRINIREQFRVYVQMSPRITAVPTRHGIDKSRAFRYGHASKHAEQGRPVCRVLPKLSLRRENRARAGPQDYGTGGKALTMRPFRTLANGLANAGELQRRQEAPRSETGILKSAAPRTGHRAANVLAMERGFGVYAELALPGTS